MEVKKGEKEEKEVEEEGGDERTKGRKKMKLGSYSASLIGEKTSRVEGSTVQLINSRGMKM